MLAGIGAGLSLPSVCSTSGLYFVIVSWLEAGLRLMRWNSSVEGVLIKSDDGNGCQSVV